jgi:hypothetical protein
MSAFRAVMAASVERTIELLCDDLGRAMEGYKAIDIEKLNDDELLFVDAKFRDVAGKMNFFATDAQTIAARVIDKETEGV